MYTTLDRLEQITYQKKRKKFKFRKELQVLATIAGISTVLMLVFTNAQLFLGGISDAISDKQAQAVKDRDNQNSKVDNSISQMIAYSSHEIQEIHTMIDDFKEKDTQEATISASSESDLKTKIKDYPFQFNMLPPTNRLIIPSRNLDVPLITSIYKGMEDFNNGKFDEELSQGVVKYPTTPQPGEDGNTLIFGHTSTEYWKKNPYATVFKDLPTLQKGELIKVVRNGKVYTYKVVDHRIVYPKDVNENYLEFQDKKKDYVTLMGCYPIGKATKRYLLIAEEVE